MLSDPNTPVDDCNPVDRLHVHLCLLVERFVPTKVIRVLNKDMPWFNGDGRRAFDLNQEAHLRWTRDRSRVNWDEFVHYQRRANEVNTAAGRQFSVRRRDVLINDQSAYKWWSTLKSAVVGSSSDLSLPPLIGGGGVLSWSGRQKCCRPILTESSPGPT